MKKFLIATTALVATAGVAAADITLSGDGRMGVVYDGGNFLNHLGEDKATLNFNSRIRVKFNISGETDGGLQFGGSFRANDAGLAADGRKGEIYISGAFGRLAMGNTVSAAEELIGDLPEIGYSDVGPAGGRSDNDIIYITGDNDGNPVLGGPNTRANALYTYSTGALKFALSMNDGRANYASTTAATRQEYALGASYTMDAYSVSLAYEVSDPAVGNSAKHLILGGDATFGDTTVKAFYGDGSGTLNGFTQYGLGVSSKFDAITVKAYIRKDEVDAGSAAVAHFAAGNITTWGLGGEYALGGGATVAGGLTDNDVAGSKVRGDLGIKFAF